MEKALLEVLGNEPENEGFVIDSDSKAEWALERIKAEKQDMERLIKICEERIAEYQQKIEQFKKQYENRTAYLKTLLAQYFYTVSHRKTKTQESYTLPSGKLILKYPGPEFQKDDEKLIEFLEKNGYEEFIQIKKLPKWGEFKKNVIVSGQNVITQDGLVVEGVKAVERAPEFIVEV